MGGRYQLPTVILGGTNCHIRGSSASHLANIVDLPPCGSIEAIAPRQEVSDDGRIDTIAVEEYDHREPFWVVLVRLLEYHALCAGLPAAICAMHQRGPAQAQQGMRV